jgi:hypothetical protein
MDILEENATGMVMEDIFDTMEKIKSWIDGYVDDTSLFTNLPYGERNLLNLIQLGQLDGQIWEKLLNISGGELELTKCFYYLLSWKWDKNGIPSPQTKIEKNMPSIVLESTTTKQITQLDRKEVTESHKTLGAYKCIY